MATRVMNTSRVPLQVGIILADGTKSSIRVMGRGRPTLGEGETVDPTWLALYGQDVRVVEEKSVDVASVAAATKEDAMKNASAAVTQKADSTTNSAETVAPSEDK